MKLEDLKIKIFADGADIKAMKDEYHKGIVKGFTTNPTLMKKAGVSDYVSFLNELVHEIPDLPLSFEVFSDDFATMEREALKLSGLGSNVMVKIPISNTKGESSCDLIHRLSEQGVAVNVTAVLTLRQVREAVDALVPGRSNYISVFAGRIADTGINPIPVMTEAAKICHQKAGTELLWASCREVLNIVQAQEAGADIITVTYDILRKLPMIGKDNEVLSLETVRMFYSDAKSLGYSII